MRKLAIVATVVGLVLAVAMLRTKWRASARITSSGMAGEQHPAGDQVGSTAPAPPPLGQATRPLPPTVPGLPHDAREVAKRSPVLRDKLARMEEETPGATDLI